MVSAATPGQRAAIRALTRCLILILFVLGLGTMPARADEGASARLAGRLDTTIVDIEYRGIDFAAVIDALDLTKDDIRTLAKNSFHGSFLSEGEKRAQLAAVDLAG